MTEEPLSDYARFKALPCEERDALGFAKWQEQQSRPQPWGSDGLMALAAFRYCLGRMTYIVDDCERWIFANWDHFPPNVRKLIQRDVEEEFERDDEARARGSAHFPLGHDCDRAAWERVRGLWATEKHRRTTP